MTAPVATFKHPLENWYTVAFYVPEKYQSSPPEPTNPDVYTQQLSFTVFAR